MKKLIILIWLILAIDFASAQFQVNFPNNNVVLNDVISWDVQSGATNPKICLWVFGNSGYCASTTDGAKTWTEAIIDSQKRDIKIAEIISEGVFLIAGGAGNDLAKYSVNSGLTWQDIPLSEKIPVLGFSLRKDSRILIFHREYAEYWNRSDNTFARFNYPSSFLCYGSTGDKNTVFWGERDDGGFAAVVNVNDGIVSKLQSSPAISGDMRLNKMITVVYENSSNHEFYYDAATHSNVILPVSGQATSSLIIEPNDRWHVGGVSGQSAFIVKNGQMVKELAGFKLNRVRGCGLTDYDIYNYPTYTNIVSVGEKGKIYSDYSKLAPVSTGTIATYYIVTDTVAIKGWSGSLGVAGSQAGVTYKVYANSDVTPIFQCSGTGKSWRFPASTLATETKYRVTASINDQTVDLDDKGILRAIPDSEIYFDTRYYKDITIKKGDSASVYLSNYGNNTQLYRLISSNQAPSDTVLSKRYEQICLKVSPTNSTWYNLEITDAEWLDCRTMVSSLCIVRVDFSDAISVTTSPVAKIYPNPCSDYINYVPQSSASEKHRVEIYDISGRKIMIISNLISGNNRIDTSNLFPGIYFLDGQKIVKK